MLLIGLCAYCNRKTKGESEGSVDTVHWSLSPVKETYIMQEKNQLGSKLSNKLLFSMKPLENTVSELQSESEKQSVSLNIECGHVNLLN